MPWSIEENYILRYKLLVAQNVVVGTTGTLDTKRSAVQCLY